MAQADQPDRYDDELARIDASIAELKVRDLAAAKERTQIAAKIQAAQFQRDILSHANQQQKAKRAPKTRRGRRRSPDFGTPPPPPPGDGRVEEPPPPPPGAVPVAEPPPPPPGEIPVDDVPPPGSGARPRAAGPRPEWAAAGSPHTGPPGIATDGVTMLVDDPPPTEQVTAPARPRAGFAGAEQHHHPPEASSQSVQNILLALGALLIGVASVVFAGVAVSNPIARATILAIATAIALVVAPGIADRGLSSTADTVAGVGLVLLPMTLFALHGTAVTGGTGVPVPLYLGISF
ncbi:MAG TPA: hypothetical protein VGB74_06540, partial [Actinoplanes sp.]